MQEPTDIDLDTKLMIIEANVNGYTQGLKDSSKAEPCDDAVSRLDKIRQIIAIPNSVIQEDVMKYKMICEVMNDDKSVS